jgi:hypothetical protein
MLAGEAARLLLLTWLLRTSLGNRHSLLPRKLTLTLSGLQIS